MVTRHARLDDQRVCACVSVKSNAEVLAGRASGLMHTHTRAALGSYAGRSERMPLHVAPVDTERTLVVCNEDVEAGV
jgi:hypothetical protein